MGKVIAVLDQLKALIPVKGKMIIKAIFDRAEIISYPRQSNSKLSCPICDKKVEGFDLINRFYLKNFDEHGFPYSVYQFETLNTFAYTCPKCGSNDRERLYGLYMKSHLYKEKSTKFSMVDFAPSKMFSNFVKNLFPNVDYRSADLCREYVDDKVDITNMDKYDTDKFDFFICSHILEHVKEDKLAIGELFRILKDNGKGIVMVPIMLSIIEDYENDCAITPADRWKHFAQSDHVRLYSKGGFIQKLEEQGFIVNQYGIDFFGEEQFVRHGIHPRSILYVVQKISNKGTVDSIN